MANSADVAAMQATRSNMIALLQTETAAQLAGGPKPSYSLDGVSYSWTEWREAMLRQIREITELIQLMSQPWRVRERTKS